MSLNAPRIFRNLNAEASDRQQWAGEYGRWGTPNTTWLGFWVIAFFGRIRDRLDPTYKYPVQCGLPDNDYRLKK
jgi:hypothetical protein